MQLCVQFLVPWFAKILLTSVLSHVPVWSWHEKGTRVGFSPSRALGDAQNNTPRSLVMAKSNAVPKLKDLWLRNVEPSGLKRTASNNNWECYKQEEIDEEVLAQLPAEIQKELRDSLKLHQHRPLKQRPTKRPSNISDFFPSSSK